MGNVDIAAKNYLKDNVVFADIFNYCLFQGEQRVKAEDLRELDPVQTQRLMGRETQLKDGEKAVSNSRDLLKRAIVRSDGSAHYILRLGLEPQSWIDYAMPVRVGAYDFGEYQQQVKQIARNHRNARDHRGHSRNEFMSGFYKDDYLIPVVTVVLYLGSDEWDGPLSIHEMMRGADPVLLRQISDYRMNLLTPAAITEEELLLFKTNVREVLGYIKYSGDENALEGYVSGNSRMNELDADAARLIMEVTKTKLDIAKESKEVDMCKAIDDMKRHSREAGKEEGREEGMISTARKMFENGLSLEFVRKCTDQLVSDQCLLDLQNSVISGLKA